VPRIYGRLANLVGPEKKVGDYKFNTTGCTEGLILAATMPPVIEGMNVTGYNESNSCKLVNEYSNSIDIDPSKFTSMLDNCRADL
jgi:NifU-like protein involved in Fe-S cluster formation